MGDVGGSGGHTVGGGDDVDSSRGGSSEILPVLMVAIHRDLSSGSSGDGNDGGRSSGVAI